MAMSPYEAEVMDQIRVWQAEPPGPATRLFGRAAGPASRAVQGMVPAQVLRSALQGAQRTATRFSGEAALLKRADVATIEALREHPLDDCDRLAVSVRRRALAMGGAGGAVFGFAGKAGLVLDIPGLLVLALRTIHRVGLCYGEDCLRGEQKGLVIAMFALASANSEEEKAVALEAVRYQWAAPELLDAAWRDGVERAAERELAKEAATFGLSNLARSLSVHLGWRKAASAIPVMGALIGGSVNAWYVHDVGRVAQHCFQERWLWRRYPELRHDRGLGSAPQPSAA
jgi:hypothetical protein